MMRANPNLASCSNLLLSVIAVAMASTCIHASELPELPVPLLVSYSIIIGGIIFMGGKISLYVLPDQVLPTVMNITLFGLYNIGRCYVLDLEDPVSRNLNFLAGCAALTVAILIADSSDRSWTPGTLSGALVLQIIACGLWVM